MSTVGVPTCHALVIEMDRSMAVVLDFETAIRQDAKQTLRDLRVAPPIGAE
jgi:hypothetical protein